MKRHSVENKGGENCGDFTQEEGLGLQGVFWRANRLVTCRRPRPRYDIDSEKVSCSSDKRFRRYKAESTNARKTFLM